MLRLRILLLLWKWTTYHLESSLLIRNSESLELWHDNHTFQPRFWYVFYINGIYLLCPIIAKEHTREVFVSKCLKIFRDILASNASLNSQFNDKSLSLLSTAKLCSASPFAKKMTWKVLLIFSFFEIFSLAKNLRCRNIFGDEGVCRASDVCKKVKGNSKSIFDYFSKNFIFFRIRIQF